MLNGEGGSEEDIEQFPNWFNIIFNFFEKTKFVWISLSFIILLWGAATGKQFIEGAEDVLSAPAHTRAHDDFKALQRYFPEFANEKRLLILISCLPSASTCQLVCPSTACGKNCKGENNHINQAVKEISSRVFEMSGIKSYQSYYNFSGTALDAAKCSFASKDGRATFLAFTFTDQASNTEKHRVINKLLSDYFVRYNPDESLYYFGVTGFDVIAKEGSESAISQMIKVDVFTMPIAFALLGYMVRSWRLLVVALLNTGLTMAFAFALLNFISEVNGQRPLSITSSLVEVITIALAIDYSLFFLRRFRDELKNERTTQDAIKISFYHAGHVVLLSSLTFSCVFAGFQFIPSHSLHQIGQDCMTAIIIALISCSINTVCIVLAFPEFFTQNFHRNKSVNLNAHENEADRSERRSSSVSLLGRTVTGKLRHRRGAKYQGCYFNFLKYITRFPYNVMFIFSVYGLSIPIAVQALKLEYNQDLTQAIPANSQSSKTFDDLRKAFSGGTLSPFYIVIENSKNSIFNEDLFNFMHHVTDNILKTTDADSNTVSSIANIQGKKVSFDEARKLLNPDSLFCRTAGKEECVLYQYIFAQFARENAVLISLTIHANPYGSAGADFISSCLDILDEFEGLNGYHLHLNGDEVDANAEQQSTLKVVPVLLITTITVIFVLLGLGFRSLLTPIRLSLTVFLPLMSVFGFAVMVYQDGVLEWTGFNCFQKSELGFFW